MRSDRFRERCAKKGINIDDVCITAVTIREPGVDRAIELRQKGVGPDRLLMMVSTEEEHHFANSGTHPAASTGRRASAPSRSATTPA